MLGRLSIRARLTAAFAAALVVVLVLAGLFVYLRVASDLSGAIDDGLVSRTNTLVALIGSEQGPPELQSGRFVGGEEAFTQILTPSGKVVESTLEPGVGAALAPAELERAASEAVRIEGRAVPGVEGKARILARPADSVDGTYIAVTGASTDDRRETLAGLARAFLLGAPVAILLASGLGYLLAGRSLAPVEAMRRRAAEVTLERSGERLPLPRADDEIRRLGKTLNEMLDRIESSLEREREFVGDASHELRTPLAILRTELDLAGREGRSADELRAALRSAGEEVDRLTQLAEDLLVLARSDQGRLPLRREPVELAVLLERVRDRFARRASAVGRELVADAPSGTRANLDPLRLEQALGNLVDNALRHGEGEVRLAAVRNGDRAVFEVSDEGAGFPPEFEGRAFERFTRADGGRTAGGAGLGLAIARAIAEAHDGEATAGGNGDPRTIVRISVPA
jgi:signal transduction histidine kinase